MKGSLRLQKKLFIALGILLLAIAGYVSFRNPVEFDVGYNYLTYKNLADLGKLEYRYGLRWIPHTVETSTGPTVYLPILAFNLLLGSDGIFVGSAAVVTTFLMLLLVAIWVLTEASPWALGLIAAVVVLSRGLADSRLLQIPLGETPAFALIFLAVALIAMKPTWTKVRWAAFFAGLALLTKFASFLGVVPLFAVACWRSRQRLAAMGKKALLARSLIVAALFFGPDFFWTEALPRTMASGEYRAYRETITARRDYEWDNGMHNVKLVEDYLRGSGPPPAALLSERIAASWETTAKCKGGTWVFLGLLGSIAALGAALWRRKDRNPMDEAVLCVLAFAAGELLWHIVLNGHVWYRYYYLADLAIAVAAGLAAYSIARRPPGRVWRATPFVILVLTADFGAIPDLPTRLAQLYEEHLAQRELAGLIREKDPTLNRYFGLGWFQAPALQSLTRNNFANIGSPDDVRTYVKGFAGNIYGVTDANSPNDVRRWMQARTAAVEFDRKGYSLYRLDPGKIESAK